MGCAPSWGFFALVACALGIWVPAPRGSSVRLFRRDLLSSRELFLKRGALKPGPEGQMLPAETATEPASPEVHFEVDLKQFWGQLPHITVELPAAKLTPPFWQSLPPPPSEVEDDPVLRQWLLGASLVCGMIALFALWKPRIVSLGPGGRSRRCSLLRHRRDRRPKRWSPGARAAA
jgi:hypothetical protein